MLHLLLGPSGSGKTALLTKEIKQHIENKERCILVVPEQQAYISERDLPRVLPNHAGLYFEIVNFSRLADGIFRKYGGVVSPTVSTGMRKLLLWDAMRELSPLLMQFGKAAQHDMTLTGMVLKGLDEMKASGITAKELEAAVEDLPKGSALANKLSDLAMLQTRLTAKTEKVFGCDPSDRLKRAAKLLETKSYFQDTYVYFDSFTSFTAPQYALIKRILKEAADVTVALCADGISSTLTQFEPSVHTALRLLSAANEESVKVERKILPPNETVRPKAIRNLERNLWNFSLLPENRITLSGDEKKSVRLVVIKNIYEEAEAAALNVLELVQSGISYGEIVLYTRDPDSYRGVLDAAFERYGIPFFLSERTDLSSKPISRLLLSALRAVAKGYQLQDLLTLIKTGLAGIDTRDASMFEDYCETWHLNRSRFLDEIWSMNPNGLTTNHDERSDEILEAANRVRDKVMTPLKKLSASLRAAQNLSDSCAALAAYAEDLNLQECLVARAKEELLAGFRREAAETLRLYSNITDTMLTLVKLLPDAKMTADEFLSAMTVLLSETDLGSVPNVNDCVMIGSAATMRVENVRAALLLGLCDGDFPRSVTVDGIFSESEKAELSTYGVSFDAREDSQNAEELFYVYRAMTKPTVALRLFAESSSGESGRAPSIAFTRVSYLLGIEPEVFNLEAFRQKIGKAAMPEHSGDVSFRMPEQSGVTLSLSQSTITRFVSCPYSYFTTHDFALREPKDARPSYSDTGMFLHYVVENFLSACIDKNKKFELPTPADRDILVDDIINEYICLVYPLPISEADSRMIHIFSRLRIFCKQMLANIVDELRNSDYVPTAFEQKISGTGPNRLPGVTIDLKDGSKVVLTGKIDRVDTYCVNGIDYIRIVDYKTGSHAFSPEDVKTGKDLQLVLYLAAALGGNPGAKAGGGELIAAEGAGRTLSVKRSGFELVGKNAPATDKSPDQCYSRTLLKKTEEEIQGLMEDMKTAARDIAARILSGEAEKTPSPNACRYCNMKSRCDKAIKQDY